MVSEVKNFFETTSDKLPEELIEIISHNDSVKIERIISEGHSSPPGFWYDQETNEFVILLEGSAILKFENGQTINLKKGDYLTIPAHVKHRVEYTPSDRKTFWLAVHFKNE